MKVGTKVRVLVPTWHAPKNWTGVVVEPLSKGLISVKYDEIGMIFDFDKILLESLGDSDE